MHVLSPFVSTERRNNFFMFKIKRGVKSFSQHDESLFRIKASFYATFFWDLKESMIYCCPNKCPEDLTAYEPSSVAFFLGEKLSG